MRCGFYGGNPLKMVKEDFPVLKPTVFPSVPRLYNRIYGILKERVNSASGCRKWLANKAINTKLDNLKANGVMTHGCYDKLVFSKFKAVLGGNVRLMSTGSAPISKDVLDFLKVCFCCDLSEGYGLTESSAASFAQMPGDKQSGYVGGPVANVKLRLRSIPEMNYDATANPPRGEVLLWGPSIMGGYFRNPEKTAEAFHDGWFCTGDVGEVAENGSLRIIDRAKNIFKLSQGEYIAPEKLENIFVQSQWVAQCWVHGDSLHDFCLLFVVVDEEKTKQFAQTRNLEWNDALMDNEELKKEIYADILSFVASNKLNSLEKPKQLFLIKDPFTIENDLLTPTMKLKRNIAKKVY